MKLKKASLIGLIGALEILLSASAMSREPIDNNAFTVKKSKVLSVMDGASVFIEKDCLDCFDLNIADEILTGKKGEISAINVIHKSNKNLQFRKEIAIHPDGHLELTEKMWVFPVADVSACRKTNYSFRIPLKVLEGMKYKALIGRYHKLTWKEGTLDSKTPKGYIFRQCRYLILQNDKNAYTFDFNPSGEARDWSAEGNAVGYWNIYKKDAYISFSGSDGRVSYFPGGVHSAKVLIYKGIYEFEQKHPRPFGYIKKFAFGITPKDFLQVNCNIYSPEHGYGWLNNSNLEIPNSNSIANNCILSSTGTLGEFVIDVRPGIYIITIRCGYNSMKIGPFSISINDKTVAENLEIPAGKLRTINVAEYVKVPEKQLRIGFSGKNMWAVQSIIIQARSYQNADFKIARDFWVMDKLFSPEIELKGDKQ